MFGIIYRPVVRFEIFAKDEYIPILAYLDSGADVSLLPKSFIEILGVKITEEEISEIRGIGEGKVPVIIKSIRIKFCGRILNARMAIALIEDVPYILGREDVFDNFEITFRQSSKEIIINPL